MKSVRFITPIKDNWAVILFGNLEFKTSIPSSSASYEHESKCPFSERVMVKKGATSVKCLFCISIWRYWNENKIIRIGTKQTKKERQDRGIILRIPRPWVGICYLWEGIIYWDIVFEVSGSCGRPRVPAAPRVPRRAPSARAPVPAPRCRPRLCELHSSHATRWLDAIIPYYTNRQPTCKFEAYKEDVFRDVIIIIVSFSSLRLLRSPIKKM